MIREVKFESQDRRIKQILAALNENGIKDIEEANAICEQSKTSKKLTLSANNMVLILIRLVKKLSLSASKMLNGHM